MNGMENAAYGTSKEGVMQIIEDIKSKVLNDVAKAAENTEDIKNACRKNWKGGSCDRFLELLDQDVSVLQLALYANCNNLTKEINSAMNSIFEFDDNLID